MPSPEASNDDVRGVAVIARQGSDGFDWFEPACAPPATHVAHSLAPEAQAKRREAAREALGGDMGASFETSGHAADAVLKVLGLST